MADLMDLSLKDIIDAAKEKVRGAKSKIGEEAEDIKEAWFKFLLKHSEEMQEKITALEKRIEELEKNECKCDEGKGTTIQS